MSLTETSFNFEVSSVTCFSASAIHLQGCISNFFKVLRTDSSSFSAFLFTVSVFLPVSSSFYTKSFLTFCFPIPTPPHHMVLGLSGLSLSTGTSDSGDALSFSKQETASVFLSGILLTK